MTGPYKVSLRSKAACDGCSEDSRVPLPCACDQDGGPVLYLQAFATLEEADRATERTCVAAGYSIGELRAASSNYADRNKLVTPNGDVIEVEATTTSRILAEVSSRAVRQIEARAPRASLRWQDAQLLAAWNAEHGIGIGVAR